MKRAREWLCGAGRGYVSAVVDSPDGVVPSDRGQIRWICGVDTAPCCGRLWCCRVCPCCAADTSSRWLRFGCEYGGNNGKRRRRKLSVYVVFGNDGAREDRQGVGASLAGFYDRHAITATGSSHSKHQTAARVRPAGIIPCSPRPSRSAQLAQPPETRSGLQLRAIDGRH
jgi:hypothetical protein